MPESSLIAGAVVPLKPSCYFAWLKTAAFVAVVVVVALRCFATNAAQSC